MASLRRFHLFVVFLLLLSTAAPAEPLTAIDVLLLPDQTMTRAAKRANDALREDDPAGFALDPRHRPHITLLQRYVRTKDLGAVYEAVGRILDKQRPAGWELTATGYFHVVFDGHPLVGIVVEATPELRELQKEIARAVAPFTENRGAANAFVTTPDDPTVNASTLRYVENFVPAQIGERYRPHVTVGIGTPEFVRKLQAAPFKSFEFKIAGAAVFHLGDYGTAARELWKWEPQPGDAASTDAVDATSPREKHDPLPSWNDREAKRALIAFIDKVTAEGSTDFVPPHERIATFDNDGTLWCEMPIYTQFAFAVDRVKQLAPEHPEWKTKQPYRAMLEGDEAGIIASGELALVEAVLAGSTNITTSDFEMIVRDWLATARHPRFQRPYTQLAYQPMLELLAYLRASGFRTYIVSGGGIEFMRPWTMRVYGVPPEQVIGTTVKTRYDERGGEPILLRLPEMDFVDDGPGKAVAINRVIGRRPIMAFGNSDGDYEMLRWTTAGSGPRFGLIVHHTDGEREYAYDYPSLVGQLHRALEEAPRRGWTVVNMKEDWKTIFPSPGDESRQ